MSLDLTYFLQKETYNYYSSDIVDEWLSYVYADMEAKHFPFGAARRLIINEILKEVRINGTHAIDIGCGGGQLSIELAKLGFNVTGIDFSEAMLKSAKLNINKLGLTEKISLHNEDFSNFDQSILNSKCNLAISMGFIEYFKDEVEFFSKVSSLMKGGGYLVVEFRNRTFNAITGNKYTLEEVSSGNMEESVEFLQGFISNTSFSTEIFIEYLTQMSKALDLLKKQPVNDNSPLELSRSFPCKRKQHHLSDIVKIANECEFEFIDLFGLHPHPFLPVIEEKCAWEFNRIAWALQCIPKNPFVIINSSSIVVVFKKWER